VSGVLILSGRGDIDKTMFGGDHRCMSVDPSFAPTLLLAMPQLRDPNFNRSVVLLCEHGEEGAIGFVVNRPTDLRAAESVALDPPVRGDSGLMLWTGGPVEPQRGFLLLGEDPGVGDSEQISDGFHLTASVGVLRRLLEAEPAALASQRCRLLLGYAGWGPGQLDAELAASAWLTAALDPALVFETPPDEMWERAIRGLGVDPMALQLGPGIQ
jgi:putative transcriptional regulator